MYLGQAGVESLSSAFPGMGQVPEMRRERAEGYPRALRVSVGCVTFQPCRGGSRTHSSSR
jgi:hypothetical protein